MSEIGEVAGLIWLIAKACEGGWPVVGFLRVAIKSCPSQNSIGSKLQVALTSNL